MENRPAPQIDMTLDGQFREPATTPFLTRVMRTAIIVAVVAGFAAFVALMLWFALLLIPVAIGAGLIAYAAFRFQVWKMRRNGAASRNLYR